MKTLKRSIGLVLSVTAAAHVSADNLSTYGTPVSTEVLLGESYAGITLTASAATFGGGGFDDYGDPITLGAYGGGDVIFNPPAGLGPGGADGFGSTLTILAGTASADTDVILSVRKPNDNEVFGYSTMPPMSNSPGYNSLLSDVYSLTGIAGPGTVVDGKTQTDVFALQISYLDNSNTDPESYLEDYVFEYGFTAPWTEADMAAEGELQLGFFDTSTGMYSEDYTGTINPGTTVVENYQGSWSSFVAAYSVTDGNLATFNGSWGVDIVANNVWLITDHNTEFAVVPEPHSSVLLAAAGMLLLSRRRRR